MAFIGAGEYSSSSAPSLIVSGDKGVYFWKSDSLYVHEAGGFASECKGRKGRRHIVIGPLDGRESLCERCIHTGERALLRAR